MRNALLTISVLTTLLGSCFLLTYINRPMPTYTYTYTPTASLGKYDAYMDTMRFYGCSSHLAKIIRQEAKAHGLDPLTVGALIWTESRFQQNVVHALPYVLGVGGVNIKAHPQFKELAGSLRGNVQATCIELADCIKNTPSLVKAITRQKGQSKLGGRQARYTCDIISQFHETAKKFEHKEKIKQEERLAESTYF